MNKEQQDKLWSELSEESKKLIRDKFAQIVKDAVKPEYQEEADDDVITELWGKQSQLIELFGYDNLQPKPLTYEDVAKSLFENKTGYVFDQHDMIKSFDFGNCGIPLPLNCTSRKQAEKLMAINRLLNVARFLNGKDWKPDEIDGELWTIGIEKYNKTIMPVEVGAYDWRTEIVYFRTKLLVEQAVQILGEEIIRLALGDY